MPITRAMATPPAERFLLSDSGTWHCPKWNCGWRATAASAAHPLSLGIEQWLAGYSRRPPLAEDFHREPILHPGQLRRNKANGDRLADMMRVAARSDPSDDLAVVPDRLVALRVGTVVVDDEGR